jgi:hypothetical protein
LQKKRGDLRERAPIHAVVRSPASRAWLKWSGITQLPCVTSSVDPSQQTVTITITDLSLFAPPSFWCLTVQKP